PPRCGPLASWITSARGGSTSASRSRCHREHPVALPRVIGFGYACRVRSAPSAAAERLTQRRSPLRGADAFDPERFIRLQEAAFNLAARIRDFTVFRNLFADQ